MEYTNENEIDLAQKIVEKKRSHKDEIKQLRSMNASQTHIKNVR